MTERVVSFRPFEPSEIASFLAVQRASYLDELERSGMSRKEAQANLDRNEARMFEGGVPAEGQHFGHVVVDGDEVGVLWLGLAGEEPDRWHVYDVEIDEEKRGRGFGRLAMLLAESFAREGGAATLGLNVFAFNKVARSLYQSLGYEESAIQMRKAL
ncbi:MAG: GNAT family N-acetyltransferase [Acidimicrobiales bacterium]